jgi:dTDP-4-amino-4,6-dideoxygalactose transaminase
MPVTVQANRLAIDGGKPVRAKPAPSWPCYDSDEIAAVVEILRSGHVNQWTGHRVREFERAFGVMFGQRHAVALASGSLALEAVLRAYGIGRGDEVVVTARSFIASASCVDIVGATPVFADIDIDTELITPATVRPIIGPCTKAIIVVHLNGRPADMIGFMKIAERYSLLVIEDCAQAHGASINGQLLGTFGHAAAFSFCQDKIITTGGEGGLALFKEETIQKRAWAYKDNGKDYDCALNAAYPPGYRWVHHSIGSNWRLTEMQAAIGLLQLPKLAAWIAARRQRAGRLGARLSAYPSIHITPLPEGYKHAYYRLEFRIKPERLKSGWNRDRILDAFNAEGIPCFVGFCPEIYRERAYAQLGQHHRRLPNAAYLGTVSLTFLVHPTIDEEFLSDCEATIEKILDVATA